MNCGLTVLRTIGNAFATKQWSWNAQLGQWRKVSYTAGARFTAVEHQVANLAGLVDVLEATRRDPRAFVVRGALTAEAAANPDRPIRRRKHEKGGIVPTLVEVPRSWVLADVDNWPLPKWADLVDDPDTVIDTAIHALLPEAFHDAECWWQLSSSAGFAGDVLKVHLFFWLTEPATNQHIKAVLKQDAPGIDRMLFSAAQPHYIADPIIEGGHDPLPRRTGWRRGIEPAVVLPALRPEATRLHTPSAGSTGRTGDVADALAALGHGEDRQGFHAPLRLATMRYARRCSRMGDRDDVAFKAELRHAIRTAPCRPGGDVENPYTQDYYLDGLITGAFALLAGNDEPHTTAPHFAAPSASVDGARADMATHIAGFLGRALDFHRPQPLLFGGLAPQTQQPEHAALVVDVGLGKTRSSREALAGYITSAMDEGLPHRVLWMVPTHKLGNETLAAMQEQGLSVAVMRGREADEPGTADPENDIPHQQMCLNIPAVEDALTAGYDVESSACGSLKPGHAHCPYHTECGYQRQKQAVAEADIVIASHQSLFHQLPKVAREAVGLVVADESWWQSGLQPNRINRLSAFAEEPLSHPVLRKLGTSKAFNYATDDLATNELHALAAQAQAAFTSTADGAFISREAIVAAGLTVQDCVAAIKLEWQRKREGAVHPGMAPDARRKRALEVAGNAGIPRRVAVWTALRDLLTGTETHTGRLQLATMTDKDGAYRVVMLHTRSEIRDTIAELPMLLLDATMPVDVVRHYLPRVQVLAEVKAKAPHLTVHQILGGWGKTSLIPHDKAADQENGRRQNILSHLADFVQAKSHGNGLVITYQNIEDNFASLPGIRTGHFNAIAGLDTFGDVNALFVIGRPLPDARDLRSMGLALTGRAIPEQAARQETRGLLMADGTGVAMDVRAYEDPDLEALRAAITDAEVVQAIGRGRAINRTADNPLTVYIMADVVVPLPIDRLMRWDEARLDVMQRMAARGAVFSSPADAAKAYPDLFSSPKAAQHAIERAKADFRPIPLWIVTHRELGRKYPALISYRSAGRGQQTRTVEVAPHRLAAFRDDLEAMLGTLTVYEVQAPPDEPEPPPADVDDPGWMPDEGGSEDRQTKVPTPVLGASTRTDSLAGPVWPGAYLYPPGSL